MHSIVSELLFASTPVPDSHLIYTVQKNKNACNSVL